MDLILQPNLTTVNNVALGQVASFDLPIGPAYCFLDIMVTMTGASGKTLSSLSDFMDLLNINVNGKTQRAHLAKEIDAIQTKFGANYAAIVFNSTGSGNALVPVYSSGVPQAPQVASQTTCILRLYFQEPWRKTWAGANYRKFFHGVARCQGVNHPAHVEQFPGADDNSIDDQQRWRNRHQCAGLYRHRYQHGSSGRQRQPGHQHAQVLSFAD